MCRRRTRTVKRGNWGSGAIGQPQINPVGSYRPRGAIAYRPLTETGPDSEAHSEAPRNAPRLSPERPRTRPGGNDGTGTSDSKQHGRQHAATRKRRNPLHDTDLRHVATDNLYYVKLRRFVTMSLQGNGLRRYRRYRATGLRAAAWMGRGRWRLFLLRAARDLGRAHTALATSRGFLLARVRAVV